MAGGPPPLRVECAATRPALWDVFVVAQTDGSVFHTAAWLEAVRAAFGHEILYLTARRGPRCVGVLPLACVRSLLGGTMLVSVPYAIYGGVLACDAEAPGALLHEARLLADRCGAGSIELRSPHAAFEGLLPIDRYVTFRRELPEAAGEVLGWLPRKARAAARNAARKHGLSVRFGSGQLPVAWRLYSRSMWRLASLNYPYRFFEELVARMPDTHLVSVVYRGSTPVAGLLSFLYRETVLPYFVGGDAEARRAGAHNFIYQTLAERSVELGCRVFDFGRSRVDNTGCCDFKRFQGFEPTPLEYQCDVRPGGRAAALTPSNPKFALARRVWPRLPYPLAACLGAWVSRHVPG